MRMAIDDSHTSLSRSRLDPFPQAGGEDASRFPRFPEFKKLKHHAVP
jgi:hypothetical protein